MLFGVYHGCLNSFVISDDNTGDLNQKAKRLCEEYHTDGYITLHKDPLEMLYFNADGSQAPMCGNGIRCFTRFLYDLGLIKHDVVKIKTLGGIYYTQITSLDPFMVKVNLGKPSFSPQLLDITTDKKEFIQEKLTIDDEIIEVSCVFMGTHHCVAFVEEIKETDLGEKLCHHPLFTKQMNVNFVNVIDRKNIFVKTFERGVGWTKACGTGACSSYVIAKRLNLVNNEVTCTFEGGKIHLETIDDQIIMEGPVEVIKEIESE